MLRNPAASGARQVSRTDSQLVAGRRWLASAGATPLPPRPTLKSGPASFATTSVANLPPSLRGANRTFTVQVPPGAIAGPVQVCFPSTKFLGAAPARCRRETVRPAFPLFVMTTCLTLVIRPNATSVKVTVAFDVPAVVGRNVIWALHEPPGWICAPQLPVRESVNVASPVSFA